jgi:hypothetical protein
MDDIVKQDFPLIRRAAQSRWDIPTTTRDKVVKKLTELVHSSEPELALGAMNTLAKLDQINVQDEKLRAPNININVSEASTEELIEKFKQLTGEHGGLLPEL